MSGIMVIAPHPDDEAIGPGGTVALHIEAGHEVYVLYMTQGELGCPGMNQEDTATLRIHEGFEASTILGSTVNGFWKEPDGGLAVTDELINSLARRFAILQPDMVYVTHEHEAHPDHRAAFHIVKGAVERGFIKPKIIQYEVWTPMVDYDPLLTQDITNVIGIKMRAIRRHESQVARIRFDEAALCLARFRGELHNRPHGMYAEVFKETR